MGIGRREFLQMFGVGIAAAASTTASVAIADNYYINRRLGIAFEKPETWVFAYVKQMTDVKAGQVLDFDDPELSRLIAETTQLPILTISKEAIAADSDHFTPGATVYLHRFSAEETADSDVMSLGETLKFDALSCAEILKDFRPTSEFTETTISACAAAQYDAQFTFEHHNMPATPVRMRTLVIDQATAFYTIRMYDSPYLGGAMVFDYSSFIESIQMV